MKESKEQDVITRRRLKGVTHVSGEMTADGGGDVETWEIGGSAEGDDEDDKSLVSG